MFLKAGRSVPRTRICQGCCPHPTARNRHSSNGQSCPSPAYAHCLLERPVSVKSRPFEIGRRTTALSQGRSLGRRHTERRASLWETFEAVNVGYVGEPGNLGHRAALDSPGWAPYSLA